VDNNLVQIVNDIDNVQLSLEDAIPCGLIINELITNAFKYAFPQGVAGEIHLSIKKNENQISLTLSDNGTGLPADFDFKNTTTLGMQLINSFNLIFQQNYKSLSRGV
jgi:two-component sensor histidine kinase